MSKVDQGQPMYFYAWDYHKESTFFIVYNIIILFRKSFFRNFEGKVRVRCRFVLSSRTVNAGLICLSSFSLHVNVQKWLAAKLLCALLFSLRRVYIQHCLQFVRFNLSRARGSSSRLKSSWRDFGYHHLHVEWLTAFSPYAAQIISVAASSSIFLQMKWMENRACSFAIVNTTDCSYYMHQMHGALKGQQTLKSQHPLSIQISFYIAVSFDICLIERELLKDHIACNISCIKNSEKAK